MMRRIIELERYVLNLQSQVDSLNTRMFLEKRATPSELLLRQLKKRRRHEDSEDSEVDDPAN
jgi:hypothetical protein